VAFSEPFDSESKLSSKWWIRIPDPVPHKINADAQHHSSTKVQQISMTKTGKFEYCKNYPIDGADPIFKKARKRAGDWCL
jgi:hypothetical protein